MPFVSPVTVIGEWEPVAEMFPGDDITSKTRLLKLLSLKETVAVPFPGTAVTVPLGTSGAHPTARRPMTANRSRARGRRDRVDMTRLSTRTAPP